MSRLPNRAEVLHGYCGGEYASVPRRGSMPANLTIGSRTSRACGVRLRIPPTRGHRLARPRIISAAFSAIMITGAFVLPEVTIGMTDASMTRNDCMPCTRNC